MVNDKYMRERSPKHAADSLEKVVENLVKTWEMEAMHKVDMEVRDILLLKRGEIRSF